MRSYTTHLKPFFQECAPRQYKKGEIIIRPDDDQEGMVPYVYFIESGFVKGYMIDPDGSERIILMFDEGDLLHIVWEDMPVRGYFFFEAMTPCVIHKRLLTDFKPFVRTNPGATDDLFAEMTLYMHSLANRVNMLTYLKARTRLIAAFAYFAKRFNGSGHKPLTLTIPLTQSDIANNLCLTRETVSREMNTLMAEGLVQHTARHEIIIPDLKKLNAELMLPQQLRSA